MLKLLHYNNYIDILKSQATATALVLKHAEVTSIHILLSVITSTDTIVKDFFNESNINTTHIKNTINNVLSNLPRHNHIKHSTDIHTSSELQNVFNILAEEYNSYLDNKYLPLLLLLILQSIKPIQLICESGGLYVDRLMARLAEHGVVTNEVTAQVLKGAGPIDDYGDGKHVDTLDKYTVNITQQVRQYQTSPCVGRDSELDDVIKTLLRHTKNNIIILGEPGVGKTNLIEGLAYILTLDSTPVKLKDTNILSLEISKLVADGVGYGELVNRVNDICTTIQMMDGKVILFIDEIHILNSMKLINIMKPYLSKKMWCIGATSLKEYREHIESDSAFMRRFHTLTLTESSVHDSINILTTMKAKYEQHHGISISDDVIEFTCKLANLYINNRQLPDKAFDLLDEASSYRKLLLTKKLSNVNVLHKEDVAIVLEKWTGIPTNHMLAGSKLESLRQLKQELQEVVVGQDHVIDSIVQVVQNSAVGLNDVRKPLGSFLFLGPTGVGKTELVKALAKSLFHSKDAMTRIDMSEYMEKHSVARLIGSPPGYVGYGEGGILTNMVHQKPHQIILFDEVEKAHPDVLNILLQVLDDGRLTDGQGRVVDFRNTIIIITSNLGANILLNNEGQMISPKQHELVMGVVKTTFRPEFINRLDDIIIFNKLHKDALRSIINIQLKDVSNRLVDRDIKISYDESVIEFLIANGYSAEYGVRPLKRLIQSSIVKSITRSILDGYVGTGDYITLIVDGVDNIMVIRGVSS